MYGTWNRSHALSTHRTHQPTNCEGLCSFCKAHLCLTLLNLLALSTAWSRLSQSINRDSGDEEIWSCFRPWHVQYLFNIRHHLSWFPISLPCDGLEQNRDTRPRRRSQSHGIHSVVDLLHLHVNWYYLDCFATEMRSFESDGAHCSSHCILRISVNSIFWGTIPMARRFKSVCWGQHFLSYPAEASCAFHFALHGTGLLLPHYLDISPISYISHCSRVFLIWVLEIH